MRIASDLGSAKLDSLSPDFPNDLYRYYDILRTEDPVHQDAHGVWILTRYDDVVSVLQDERFGRRGFREILNGSTQEPETVPVSLVFQDPPEHTRLRALAAKALACSLIRNIGPYVQQTVDDLIERLRRAGSADLIAEFAFPLPVYVIAKMLGVPTSDQEQFCKWAFDIAQGMDPAATAPFDERMSVAHQAIADYFSDLLSRRRQCPQDDLLSLLIAVEANGDKFSERELLDLCGLLFVAGHETTVNLIGNGILALLLHPGQLERLRGDSGMLVSAVEELLRYDSPVQRAGRMAYASVELRGKTIAKGAVISAVLGAANRDPERFTEPERLDIGRRNNRHVAFGFGDRFCLGAQLARLEGQIAIGTLVRALPRLELVDLLPTWRRSAETRGLKRLPVVF